MCHSRTSKQEASTIFQVEQVHNKSTWVLLHQLPAASTMPCIVSTRHLAAQALRQLCRAQRPCLYRASGCMVSPLGLLSGCTSSTSIVSYAATTRLPATAALHQLCRAPRLLGRTGSTSSMSCVWLPRLVTRLVVNYFASRRLVVDYFAHATRLGTSRGSSCRLVVDYFAHAARLGASARREARCAARRRLLRLAHAHRRLLHPHCASGCLGMSRGSSCGSSSTASHRVGSSSTTSPTLRVRVPRHVARLVAQLIARLVVDYFAHDVRPGASTRRAARRRLRLQACCRLLCLRHASGCTSPRAGSSSTTSPTPRVRVPQHVARLVTRLVFDYAARPGSSARRTTHHAARRAARRRLIRLCRASGCLSTSCGSSRRSSSTSTTPRVWVHRHVVRLVSPLVVDYSPMPRVRVPRHVARLVTRLVIDYSVRRDFVLRPH
jgi:hypothetical protein